MSVLVLAEKPIHSRHSGYDLRVANLSAHIPGPAHLVIAPLSVPDGVETTLPTDGLFESIEVLPPLCGDRRQPLRHLRLSDDHFLRWSFPRQFAAARDRLRAIVDERRITQVVVFGSNLAELATTLRHADTILDVCDSPSLFARREIDWGAGRPTGSDLVKAHLALRRCQVTEARLPRRFRLVTTIGPPDARELERLAKGPSNVLTIPNGVDDAFLGPLPEPTTDRAVAFWGNLAFGPNDEALRFFLHEIYRPVLGPAGVRLGIVGPNAPRWLEQLAAEDAGIILHGFVPDLRAVLTRYSVMVNPMRTGSGLKNKVLEAFGLGLAVVSTPLGVEALPDVRNGIHFLSARDSESFASAVLDLLDDEERRQALRTAAKALLHEKYRWEVVGEAWQGLFERTRGDGVPSAGTEA